jgi:hypothetical protein
MRISKVTCTQHAKYVENLDKMKKIFYVQCAFPVLRMSYGFRDKQIEYMCFVTSQLENRWTNFDLLVYWRSLLNAPPLIQYSLYASAGS